MFLSVANSRLLFIHYIQTHLDTHNAEISTRWTNVVTASGLLFMEADYAVGHFVWRSDYLLAEICTRPCGRKLVSARRGHLDLPGRRCQYPSGGSDDRPDRRIEKKTDIRRSDRSTSLSVKGVDKRTKKNRFNFSVKKKRFGSPVRIGRGELMWWSMKALQDTCLL